MSFLFGRRRSQSGVAPAHHGHDDMRPALFRHSSLDLKNGEKRQEGGFHGLFRRRSSDGLSSSEAPKLVHRSVRSLFG